MYNMSTYTRPYNVIITGTDVYVGRVLAVGRLLFDGVYYIIIYYAHVHCTGRDRITCARKVLNG